MYATSEVTSVRLIIFFCIFKSYFNKVVNMPNNVWYNRHGANMDHISADELYGFVIGRSGKESSTTETNQGEDDEEESSSNVTLEYKWLPNDDSYDNIVGISVNGKPVSVGVFISDSLILTSSNPLEDYIDEPKRSRVGIHAINGAWNESVKYEVECIVTPYFDSRQETWVYHGDDELNSPIHDLLVISIKDDVAPKKKEKKTRSPFHSLIASSKRNIIDTAYNFAGFGYLDEDHVRDGQELAFESYKPPILEDCDEWIPRAWGRFICLNNQYNLPALQSGTPLFRKGIVFGVGSFTVTKGEESILVFTDIRPYNRYLGFCNKNDSSDAFGIFYLGKKTMINDVNDTTWALMLDGKFEN